eukprot:988695-Alexandrium_andersonii.AAC.1
MPCAKIPLGAIAGEDDCVTVKEWREAVERALAEQGWDLARGARRFAPKVLIGHLELEFPLDMPQE